VLRGSNPRHPPC